MDQPTHPLLDGQGCPTWCPPDHTTDPDTTAKHNGKVVRIGGVDIYPTLHVDPKRLDTIYIPRLRVVIDSGDDRALYLGKHNARQLADLMELAGDTTGICEALRLVAEQLHTEENTAAAVYDVRRTEHEAATR